MEKQKTKKSIATSFTEKVVKTAAKRIEKNIVNLIVDASFKAIITGVSKISKKIKEKKEESSSKEEHDINITPDDVLGLSQEVNKD
jgi:hypothetical protein